MKKAVKKSREESIAENYFPVDREAIESSVEKPVKEIESDFKETISKVVKEIPREEILQGAIEKTFKKIDRSELEKIESTTKTKKPRGSPRKKSKENNIEEIIKKAKKKIARKSKNSSTSKRSDAEIYETPKIELKKDGYELIITEKPQAAAKIAEALGRASKENFLGVPYYEVSRNGKEIVVACAVGHLFTLKQTSQGSQVPTFEVKWVPNFLAKKNDFSKKYYNTMLKLARGAGSITVATDYDVEGELIGWNIVKLICNQNDAKRMKFSTLTKSEINNAYENKISTIDWGQAIAGETRHHLDWFYGINLSRALMNAIKKTGKFRIMSIGRVQGPALKLIVDKEREIKDFKSEPFWQVFIKVKSLEKNQTKEIIELKYVRDIFDRNELENFKDLVGKNAEAETRKTEEILPPNPPFNLTTLQTEAYKFHGITPSNTLKSAQSLYLNGLISYPRTSSQKLPDSIAYKEILKKLSRQYEVEHLIKKSKPTEGEKTDPAHPSIYPTGELANPSNLAGEEAKIYNLIARRFLSLFCEDAIIDNKKISATTIDEHKRRFTTRGTQIRKKAWMEIYPVKLKEIELPDLNGKVEILDSKIEEKETQPPKRYSQASIISELEKRNLGTKATRASILETLYDRGYVKEKSIEATSLGISLIETLEKYSPIIVDEELTRNFEEEMEKIQESFEKTKTNLELIEKEKEIIEKSKRTIEKIAQNFEENESKIGNELLKANDDLRGAQRIENTLMTCPKCGKGNLIINYSKKTRRHFVSCNAYPECKTIYSLPPDGTIKKANKNCESCNYPQILILKKGKRPWILCFNPECETNKSRLEEYRRKQAEKLEKEKSEQ